LDSTNENKEIIELFISNGADVNFKNDFGKTPLHTADQFDNEGAVEDSIKVGAIKIPKIIIKKLPMI